MGDRSFGRTQLRAADLVLGAGEDDLGLVREEGTLCPWASVLCLGVRAPADRGGDGRGSEKRAERSEHPCDLGLLPLSGDLLW